ncbi:MAG: TonB-dependent receptor [Parvularcula sp.]|jgi:iron complex outermembrane receptor protein|nr:TonB-dependent receptor [Parvularcula sp.]
MKPVTSRIAVAAALGIACASSPAWAETADDGQTETASAEQPQSRERIDDPHYRGDIIVAAEALRELDFIAGQDVLELDEIQRNLNGQLGELLVKVPGVSATSFTPGASRPILRGLDGERVRVLIDGLGSADVANTSADHATTIDPLTVTRVEVLRGPAALLYGSQAIGGVVNVIDRRIPIEVPENGVHVDGLFAADTVSDLRSGGASIDFSIGENFVVHLDGSFRETDDLEIPGFQLSPELRADLLADAVEEEEEGEFEEAEELREAANQRGFIPNSATETYTITGGLGVVLGESTFGVSVGYYDTDYGLIANPEGGHHHGEEGEEGEEEEGGEEEEIVTIGLEQLRFDFLGDIALGDGFFSNLKLRAGFSDYQHTEFEGPEVGTVFDTETLEARAELQQAGGGVVGMQYTTRDFAAIGAEAFVQPNVTDQLGVFTAQEFDLDAFQIEAAARYERVDVSSNALGVERDFDLFSGAVSFVVESDAGVRFGVTGSRSERAPAGEELFADGPHIATQQFEIGDVDLDIESSWGIEAFARGDLGDINFGAQVYYQTFDDFIFLAPTGEEEDELPVFVYLQEDADFFGFEADVNFPLIQSDGFTLRGDVRASYVEAELDDGGNVPRIPPLSVLGALDADFGPFSVRGEAQYFGEQDEVAEFETVTDDFTFVNLYVSWRPFEQNQNVVFQLAGENLFDTTGRRHSSFTKEFVPLPGRNIRGSVRLSF